MKITDTFKKRIVQEIRKDGSFNDCGDWWTSFTDEKGRVFDVNVYDNEFGDCEEDEVCVALYDCYEGDDGYFWTDYEGSEYETFIMKREDVAPTSLYKVYFTMRIECSSLIPAHSEEHAREILDVLIEEYGFEKLQYVLREYELLHSSAKEV
jgi:hypothetical protein